MEEASSKYVDFIATQKLLEEKLKRVHHHTPEDSASVIADFEDASLLPLVNLPVVTRTRNARTENCFPSFVVSGYRENDTALCKSFQVDDARGDVIFLHGLYEDNLQIYQFLITLLHEQRLNVHVMILPFHYERKPSESAFSGEFFWSGHTLRSALAFKQAVYDLVQFNFYLKTQRQHAIGIVGFSMGGGVGLTASTLFPIDLVFAINPVCNFPDLVWHRPLFATVKNDLEIQGLAIRDIERHYRAFDPLSRSIGQTPLHRIAVALGEYDQINDPRNYTLLMDGWQLQNRFLYKAGHLNILRVPKLAGDIAEFYFRGSQS